MNLLEFNDVDPLQVLHLTLLALNFPFTPELAAHMRRTDPRPFPCFTVNAVEDDLVLGQVGVFRLPMISTEGREDVGGVWAVSTHPHHAGRGFASALLEEAHSRMRAAGLRFSTLGTSRSGIAYLLYQKHGYVDMNVWATALTRWETAHQPTRLRAECAQPAEEEGYGFVETIYQNLAKAYLGFAWRHHPFVRLRDKVKLDDIWVIWENREPVGYVFAHKENQLLKLDIQILRTDIHAVEAVAAIASKLKTSYVQVTLNRPSDIDDFQRAGWQVAHPNWEAFMVKPLIPEATADDARRLFGIGTDGFLISWLDVT
ncbi:MAG: GNAT family N-acetyltransferase [Anaerolineae bacterium]|nr:GNAT family N-acetyltransferase [Anaerolineae bacterium]